LQILINNMDIHALIKDITPFYNKYKENKEIISGCDSIILMWLVGDLLKKYLVDSQIQPHSLYREIYGKSEGSVNTIQKSYITREFLSKSYRIRNIFKDKSEIQKTLPNLLKFRLFSQAMPFFDNKKYMLKGKEKVDLIMLLNSNNSYSFIINRIYALQKKKIGIRNPRTQKLRELDKDKDIFIDFYNYIYLLLKKRDYITIRKLFNINSDLLINMSKNVGALSQEGLKTYSLDNIDKLPDKWKNFIYVLNYLIEAKTPKKRRRFRRLISPKRIIRLSEMLHALSSEENYKQFIL